MIAAEYFDGRTSRPRGAQVALRHGGILTVTGADLDLSLPVRDVRPRDRVGTTAWRLELPGGASLVLQPSTEARQLMAALDGSLARAAIRGLESHWIIAGLALVLVAGAGFTFVKFGLPRLAERGVEYLPIAVEASLGEQTLAWLDKHALEPSTLDADRRAAVAATFARVVSAAPGAEAARLEVRSSPAGPNAFALPGGTVIMTDELVELAKHDGELAAVFAHELSHVVRRHAGRQLLQSSAVALVMLMVSGDLGGVTSIAAAAPVVLLEAGFSRDLEREADRDAYATLDVMGIERHHFRDILARLEAATGTGGIPEFLSSHPDSKERSAE